MSSSVPGSDGSGDSDGGDLRVVHCELPADVGGVLVEGSSEPGQRLVVLLNDRVGLMTAEQEQATIARLVGAVPGQRPGW